ncbi:MAG: electron transport complex subunit RsxE, partial [Firmicutes bacterium]|nr:electron transport complex subunit RsxE [Bacillota bacterium]
LGFTIGLTSIGIVREVIGAGQIFGKQIMPGGYEPATIFILAPGAFFVLAFLAALRAKLQDKKPKEEQKPVHCMEGGCASCGNTSCSGKFYDNRVIKK